MSYSGGINLRWKKESDGSGYTLQYENVIIDPDGDEIRSQWYDVQVDDEHGNGVSCSRLIVLTTLVHREGDRKT